MLNTIKAALRIAGTDFDNEITLNINAALSEMSGLGILGAVDTSTDPQITSAVIAFCKWQFGYNDDSEKWRAIYCDKLDKLKSMTGYTEF